MSKKTTISIIIALLALALIAGVVLGCKRKQEKVTRTEKHTTTIQEPSSQPATQPATPKPSAKKSSNLMSDWKTYTNTQMGYTINYPADWSVQKEGEPPYPGPPRGVTFSIRVGGMETVENPSYYCSIGISVSTYDDQSEMTSLENKGYAKSSIKVTGISATRFSKDHPGIADAVYFSRNGKHYRISRNRGFGTKYESEYKLVFNQMLDSFKFIK